MFRFPCSYLILSEHFNGLPEAVMKHVQTELQAILVLQKNPPKGVRINSEERAAIREMLDEYKPGWLIKKTNT